MCYTQPHYGVRKKIYTEIKKKGAPIHIVYGDHGEDSVDQLAHLDRAIGEMLRNTRAGNVVVFYEDAAASEVRAEDVEDGVKYGDLPSISLVSALFAEKHGRFPDDLEDMVDVYDELENVSAFNKAKFRIIDKHCKESGRIKVISESRPFDDKVMQEVAAGMPFIKEKYQTDQNESISAIMNGDFDRGFVLFKRSTEEMAEDVSNRNDRLAEKIASAADDPDTAAVVGCMGAAHTRLGHILERRGYGVSREFSIKEAGNVDFSPADVAVRHREMLPDGEVADVYWYGATVARAILRNLALLAEEAEKRTGDPESYQDVVQSSFQELDDMESIRRLERNVREKGFVTAIVDIPNK